MGLVGRGRVNGLIKQTDYYEEVPEVKTVEFKKGERQIIIDSIVVEISTGKVFDGNDASRASMVEAITAASYLSLTTTKWIMFDNSIVDVTLEELREAHAIAVLKKSEAMLSSRGNR